MQNIICFIVFVLLALGGFFIFGVKLPKKKNIVSISKATAKDKDNKIELPLVYKSCKQNIGKKVIYSLEEDSIKLIMDNVDDDKIFNYFKEEGIETKYIILDNFVELNSLAMKTLRLRNRDIVELCIDEEMFVISNE